MITEYDATNQRGVYKRTTTSQLLSLGISTKSKYRKMSLSTSKVEQAHILEHCNQHLFRTTKTSRVHNPAANQVQA